MIGKIIRNTEAVVLLFLILLSPASSHAQSTKQQLEELKKQIESLQSERAADQEKIAEIKTKQETVDDDAWYSKFLAKYDKGFIFESTDDKGFQFKTRFAFLAQIQGIVNDTDEELVSTNFRLRRLELRWDGYAFKPWFYYTIMIDPASSQLLKDMYLTAAYQKEAAPGLDSGKSPSTGKSLIRLQRSSS